MYKMVEDQVVISVSSICYIVYRYLNGVHQSLLLNSSWSRAHKKKEREKKVVEHTSRSTRVYINSSRCKKKRLNRWWQLLQPKKTQHKYAFQFDSHSLHTIFYKPSKTCLSRCGCSLFFFSSRKKISKIVFSRLDLFHRLTHSIANILCRVRR